MRWGLKSALTVVVVVMTALVGVGCDDDSGTAASGDDDGSGEVDCPITIGGSLSLSGNLAQQGDGVRKGYEAWVDEVNASGGLLGCDVELTLRDDESEDQTAVSIYEELISSGEVDLLIGPFSSSLVIPTSQVAEENGMLFVEPFGSAPDVFNRGYELLIYGGPAIASDRSVLLAEYVAGLPEGERPQTAAYANLDDPFAQSITDPFKAILEEAGIETVAHEVYPEQADFAAVAAKIVDSDPDLFFGGTTESDAVDLIRALGSLDFDPEILAVDAALDTFWSDVGAETAQGIVTLLDWSPALPFPGNDGFLTAYREKWDEEPDGDFAVHGYEVGQILATAVEAVGCADSSDECQRELAEYIHSNEIETVFGSMAWDEAGRPAGAVFVGQWIDGEIAVVLSSDPSIETSDIVAREGAG